MWSSSAVFWLMISSAFDLTATSSDALQTNKYWYIQTDRHTKTDAHTHRHSHKHSTDTHVHKLLANNCQKFAQSCLPLFTIKSKQFLHSHLQCKLEAGHSTEYITHAGHSITFLYFVDHVTLIFNLLTQYSLEGEVSWWTISVPNLVILVSAILVLLCGQTDRITHAAKCFSHATVVGVSNNMVIFIAYQLPCFGFQLSFVWPQSSVVILGLSQLLLYQVHFWWHWQHQNDSELHLIAMMTVSIIYLKMTTPHVQCSLDDTACHRSDSACHYSDSARHHCDTACHSDTCMSSQSQCMSSQWHCMSLQWQCTSPLWHCMS